MRTEKLSLKSVKNTLNRDELKKIMAGSGTGTGTGSTGTGTGGGCINYGLAIPCCQCWIGSPGCGSYVYLTMSPPTPYECDCVCKSHGYTGGWNDCPIARC